MTTFKMRKYVDEDGGLRQTDDAEFLRHKAAPGDTFDFTGVRSVTPAFLDALFQGKDPASLVASFQGAEGAVADALLAWVDRAGGAAPAPAPAQTSAPPPAPAPAAPAPRRPAPVFARPSPEGEKYTPTRLANRLHGQLRRYIESAYPLSDATLIKARRKLLQDAEGGRLLAQEPFVETTPRYRLFAGAYADLGLSPSIAALLTRLTRTPTDHDPDRNLLFPDIYEHQASAFRASLGADRDLVVATGTGSGKTECFLVPLLARLYEEAAERPRSFAMRGVRGLILYPMNALVNDQLSRLRLLLGSTSVMREFRALGPGTRHPLFGMYTSRTPYPGPRDPAKDADRVEKLLLEYLKEMPEEIVRALKKLGRYPAKDLEAFLAAGRAETAVYKTGKKKGQRYIKHNWPERLLTGPDDRELLTRHEMVRDPQTGRGGAPDVLVTNYSMLEYMLMRPFERPIFDETRAWLREPGSRFLLVLDEAHMYRGAKGAEVAFLLRRLFARLDVIDKPEKIRVICTSASLGGGDAEATARRFAADLTGKDPAGFQVVFGTRERPQPVAPGDPALAEVLARVPLESLQGDAGADPFIDAVAPVLRHLGDARPVTAPADVPGRLVEALDGRPWLNQVLASTAERAVPLGELSTAVFPGSPVARKATEVLLSLGTLARRSPSDASLLPTRIHMMFRGLAGLYACIDPRCRGRQERPDEEAPLGKLFAAPRALCDACGARVFELASCRTCGGAYLLARVPKGQVASARFLWGDLAGELETIQILPTRPRNEEGVLEEAIQLATGHLVSPGESAGRIRSIWLPRDRETGKRTAEFARCPLCQPPGLPLNVLRRAVITDLGTRGEQPFTALIEAQFAEQPPQEHADGLPNQGRKVLVFSDGRQRAARLAPALEMSHSRDAFRQVLLLAARSLDVLGRSPRVAALFPAVLRVCLERHIDLFPAANEVDFHNCLARAKGVPLETALEQGAQGILQPTLSYAKSLFAELTDRYFSLQAMGLASIEEEPTQSYLFNDFPDVGLSAAEARALFRVWLRAQLERRCFLPPGASPGQLGEPWERPEGIRLGAKGELVPVRFAELLHATVGEEGAHRVSAWLASLGRDKGFLVLMNDAYYLQPALLVLRPRVGEPWSRCASCSRLEVHVVRDRCADCLGQMVPADDALYLDARYGYYRDQVDRALRGDALEPFGLTTAEHSAQLSGLNDDDAFSKTETYELRFQDVRIEQGPPIDVLSCTTTMEVGIDIGALTGVALRNVPPHVANYQQRAGRAGRRGRTIASVLTYAHGGTHDAWYYEHPERIISGDVRSPVVYTENKKVLERHIHAFLVQLFFHETVAASGQAYQLFASLGTVRDFLSTTEPCSLDRLIAWLRGHRARLLRALRAWIPSYSHGFGRPIDAESVIESAIEQLIARLSRELPVDLYARASSLDDAQRAGLEMQLDALLLQTLIDRAILPRYAFPTDTVSFWVPERRRRGAEAYKKSFDYSPQRDLQIALSEYAPGRTLTIDKFRFESAALYSPYPPSVRDVLGRARAYTSCKSCGYMTLDAAARSRPACPVCQEPGLSTLDFVRPEGFAPDVNKEREIDRGGAITYAGMSTPAKLEVQAVKDWEEVRFDGRIRLLSRPETLVVVNKGVGDRGFIVCPACGAAEPVFGPGFTTPRLVGKDGRAKVHAHPTEEGGQCTGSASGPFYLGHSFLTDVLLLRLTLAPPMKCAVDASRSGSAGRMALTSLVEALCLAASRTLQIDEGELAGNWNPVPGHVTREADLYLYDLLPGGAGYTHQVRRNLDAILDEARRLLGGCDCAASCHRCLRHYNNRLVHGALDRELGLVLLEYLLHGRVPAVSAEDAIVATGPLTELFALQGVRFERGTPASAPVPLQVEVAGEMTWVDVHHPLVDPDIAGARVLEAAQATMAQVVALDTHTLVHDLPRACRLLGFRES